MPGLGIVQNSSTMVYCGTETSLCSPRPEIWECSTNKGGAAAAVAPSAPRWCTAAGQMVLAFMTTVTPVSMFGTRCAWPAVANWSEWPLSAKMRNATPGQQPPNTVNTYVRLSKTAAFYPW
jgi:hypothetical protein